MHLVDVCLCWHPTNSKGHRDVDTALSFVLQTGEAGIIPATHVYEGSGLTRDQRIMGFEPHMRHCIVSLSNT